MNSTGLTSSTTANRFPDFFDTSYRSFMVGPFPLVTTIGLYTSYRSFMVGPFPLVTTIGL